MQALKLTVTLDQRAILELHVTGDYHEVLFIRDFLRENYPVARGFRVIEESN